MISHGASGTNDVRWELVMSSWFGSAMLLAIFVVPVVVLFGYSVLDVVQRHGTGAGAKAVWLVVFCLVPLVGPLVYLVTRPPESRAQEEHLAGDETRRTAELPALAGLHDRGKLTDEEFKQAKERSIYGSHELPGSVREQRGQLL